MMIEIRKNVLIFLLLGLFLIGCRGDREPGTPTPAPTTAPATVPTTTQLTSVPTYDPYVAPVYSPVVVTVSAAYPYPGPVSGVQQTPLPPPSTDSYPAPQASPAFPTSQGATPTLVGPGISPYPGPSTGIPTVIGTVRVTATQPSVSTPAATLVPGALPTPTATARISKPLGTAPPPPSTITIWHSWRDEQLAVLDFAIQSFQDLFPDVYFNLLYIPIDELYESYRQAVYNGRGPSVLFGPAEWGPPLYDLGLVADLFPYTSPGFLSTINSAALETGIYHGAIISLPYAQRGILLIRNRGIISQPPESFEELVNFSTRATRGSNFGAYIERGSIYSAAHLEGLGGKLMDNKFNPSFDDEYGVKWLNLLLEFDRLGPASFNGDDDIELFKAGRVGMIIDGSWNLSTLAEAIGEDNITVDPWPVYAEGKLSGYVQTDAIFLNTNITGDEQLASLRFMGFLLDKDVQSLISEAGFIPSVLDAQPQSGLIRAAMIAFNGGTPYPVVPTSDYLRPYWDALNAAIGSVVEGNLDPMQALQIAEEYVSSRLDEIRNGP